MDLLKNLGIILIILQSLTGISLYLEAIGVKGINKQTTLSWLFVCCLIAGPTLYYLGSESFEGIVYTSYILFLLGILSGITLFLFVFIPKEPKRKDVLWLFFILFIPLGTIGVLYKDVVPYFVALLS